MTSLSSSAMTSQYNDTSPLNSDTAPTLDHVAIYRITEEILVPAVLGFGLLGNVGCLVILSQRKLRYSMEEFERCTTVGLVALALSDLLVCLAGLPAAFLTKDICGQNSTADLVRFYYGLYKMPLMNLLLCISSWITVLVSVGRYLMVCQPFLGRRLVRVHHTVIISVILYIMSILINLPQFLSINVNYECLPYSQVLPRYEGVKDNMTSAWGVGTSVEGEVTSIEGVVTSIEGVLASVDGMESSMESFMGSMITPTEVMPSSNLSLSSTMTSCFYQIRISDLYTKRTFVTVYNIVWTIASTLLPFTILLFCNVGLIRAIHLIRVRGLLDAQRYGTVRVTRLLVVIICAYLLLASPSSILKMTSDYMTPADHRAYLLAIAITNITQAINCSVNFLLYFFMCRHFRHVITHKWCQRKPSLGHSAAVKVKQGHSAAVKVRQVYHPVKRLVYNHVNGNGIVNVLVENCKPHFNLDDYGGQRS